MLAFAGSTTIWLVVTNALLGAAVLACCAVIGWNVLNDLRRKRKEGKDESSVPLDYLECLRDLGVSVSTQKDQIDEMEKV